MSSSYFQAAAAVATLAFVAPEITPPDPGTGEGSGFDFIVSTAAYTPPSGDRVDFTTT